MNPQLASFDFAQGRFERLDPLSHTCVVVLDGSDLLGHDHRQRFVLGFLLICAATTLPLSFAVLDLSSKSLLLFSRDACFSDSFLLVTNVCVEVIFDQEAMRVIVFFRIREVL